jgi:hypothetical protein
MVRHSAHGRQGQVSSTVRKVCQFESRCRRRRRRLTRGVCGGAHRSARQRARPDTLHSPTTKCFIVKRSTILIMSRHLHVNVINCLYLLLHCLNS